MKKLLVTTVIVAAIAGCDVKSPTGPGGVTLTSTTSTTTTTTASAPLTSAAFSVSPAATAVGQLVFVDGSRSTALPGRKLVSFDWNFGDGTQKSGMTSSHPYDSPGAFTITLTVTDDIGQRGTTTQQVSVGGAFTSTTTTAPITTAAVSFTSGSSAPNVPANMLLLFKQLFSAGAPSASALLATIRTVRPTADATYQVTGSYSMGNGTTGSVSGTLVGTITPFPNGHFTGTLTANLPGCTAERNFDGTIGVGLNWNAVGPPTHDCAGSPLAFENVSLVKTDTPPTTTSVIPPLSAGAISVSPSGTGLESATVFQFSTGASGGVPPYTTSWDFGDESSASGTTATHLFRFSSTIQVFATTTDARSSSVQANASVTVGNISNSDWSAAVNSQGVPNGVEPIRLNQDGTAVGGTINDVINDQSRSATGSGTVANPRSLSVTFNFTQGPGTPFTVNFVGSLDSTLTTWSGTVSGYGGCLATPCTFTATRQAPNNNFSVTARSNAPPSPTEK